MHCPPPRRTPGIATTLVGMATADVVAANVRTALEAAGLAACADEAAEAEALEEVEAALSDVKGMTWPSGRPENN